MFLLPVRRGCSGFLSAGYGVVTSPQSLQGDAKLGWATGGGGERTISAKGLNREQRSLSGCTDWLSSTAWSEENPVQPLTCMLSTALQSCPKQQQVQRTISARASLHCETVAASTNSEEGCYSSKFWCFYTKPKDL